MSEASKPTSVPNDLNRCSHKFSGTVMAPIPYPAYGWEPVKDADECELYAGHPGRHRGKRIEWDHPTEESRLIS